MHLVAFLAQPVHKSLVSFTSTIVVARWISLVNQFRLPLLVNQFLKMVTKEITSQTLRKKLLLQTRQFPPAKSFAKLHTKFSSHNNRAFLKLSILSLMSGSPSARSTNQEQSNMPSTSFAHKVMSLNKMAPFGCAQQILATIKIA